MISKTDLNRLKESARFHMSTESQIIGVKVTEISALVEALEDCRQALEWVNDKTVYYGTEEPFSKAYKLCKEVLEKHFGDEK